MRAYILCLALLLGVGLHPPAGALDCDAYTATPPKARVEATHAKHGAAFARVEELVYRTNFHVSIFRYQEEVALLNAIAESLQPHLPAHANVGTFRFLVLEEDETYGDARVLPSGLIVFSATTIHTSPSIDSLAGIVAHEVGHLALGHLAGDGVLMRNALADYLALAKERRETADPVALRALEARAVDLLVQVISRETLWQRLEFEADTFAAHVVRNAGYDTKVVAQLLEKEAGTRADLTDVLHPQASLRAELFRCFAQARNLEKTQELEVLLIELKGRRLLHNTPK